MHGWLLFAASVLAYALRGLCQLTVNTPVSAVQCQTVLLAWSGGTPLYFLSIIPGNQPAAAALDDLGTQQGTSVTWIANIQSGTSIAITLRDSTGALATSAAFMVQNSNDSSCIGVTTAPIPSTILATATAPSTSSTSTQSAAQGSGGSTSSNGHDSRSTHTRLISAIAGGLVALSLGLTMGFLVFIKRRRRNIARHTIEPAIFIEEQESKPTLLTDHSGPISAEEQEAVVSTAVLTTPRGNTTATPKATQFTSVGSNPAVDQARSAAEPAPGGRSEVTGQEIGSSTRESTAEGLVGEMQALRAHMTRMETLLVQQRGEGNAQEEQINSEDSAIHTPPPEYSSM